MPPENHSSTAQRARPYRARRWPLVVAPVVAVAAVAVGVLLVWPRSQPAYPVLPEPVLAGGASAGSSQPPSPSSSPSSSTASSTASSTPAAAATAGSSSSLGSPATTATSAFAPSRAVQIYLPNPNPDLAISTSIQPLGGCRSVIDPPRTGPGFAGVFGCTDFAQPGTDSTSLAVLAGHSSRRFDTVFNRLYVQGSALERQTVYLRTEDSGDRWLAYRIDHVYTPDQDDLPYLTAVWGGDGSSTAGRLVLVTCQQDDAGGPSSANYVAVAQFVGLR